MMGTTTTRDLPGAPHERFAESKDPGCLRIWLPQTVSKGSHNTRAATDERAHQNMVVRQAKEIATGMAAIHKAGVTHRDVNPKNLFVDNNGAVKIGDFGCATNDVEDMAALAGTPE
jgi:serine/threonine protein kinase